MPGKTRLKQLSTETGTFGNTMIINSSSVEPYWETTDRLIVSGSNLRLSGSVNVTGNLISKDGLTGSLQKVFDGSAYLIAGNNMSTSTASNGSVTISTSAEINTASNVGSGQGVFQTKVGVDLRFRSLTSSGSISLISGSDTINISASIAGGINVGSGQGVYKSANNEQLTFRTITSSGSISLISGSDTINISASIAGGINTGSGEGVFLTASNEVFTFRAISGSGASTVSSGANGNIIVSSSNNSISNVGSGEGIFQKRTNLNFEFRSILGTGSITILSGTNEITISGTDVGENNTASNIGSGQGVFANKSGVDLRFRSITGSGSTSIVSGSDTINISSSFATGVNTGSGQGVFLSSTNDTLTFRSVSGSGNISVLSGSDGSIIISSSAASSSGEVNTASNVGTGQGVFKEKAGVDLRFRSILGTGSITILSGTNEITISGTDVGENNTASNVGSGQGVFQTKNGVDLRFRSITASGSSTVVSGSDTINISSSFATGLNTGSGEGVFLSSANDTLTFRSISGSGNTTVTSGANGTIVVSSSNGTGEANTASNVGSGQGTFQTKVGVDLRFRTLTSSGSIALISGSDTINISASIPGGINTGSGEGVFLSATGSQLTFRSVSGSGNTTVTSGANGTIVISSSNGTGEANTASNVGSGQGVFQTKNGVDLRFRSLTSSGSIVLVSGSDTINISASIPGGLNTGSGEGVFLSATGSQLTFRAISGSGATTVSSGANGNIIISSSDSGENNTASNVGSGQGIFQTKVGVDLRFRSITGSGSISIVSGSDTINISASTVFPPSGPAGGDLSGTYPNPIVINLTNVADPVVIGTGSHDGLGTNVTIVGISGTASSSAGTAVGYNANASGLSASAYGHNSLATGSNSVAIGQNARAGASESFALGASAQVLPAGLRGIAIGNSSLVQSQDSISIGHGANTGANSFSIAIGRNAQVGASSQFVVGSDVAPITSSIFGRGPISDAPPMAFIFSTTNASPTGSNAFGSSIILAGGRGNGTASGGEIIIYSSPSGTVTGSTYNTYTESMRFSSIPGVMYITNNNAGAFAISDNLLSGSQGSGSIALGYGSRIGASGTVIGTNASGGINCIVIGNAATASFSGSIVIGTNASGSTTLSGSNTVIIGTSANCSSSGSVVIGFAAVGGGKSVIIGDGATGSVANLIAIGAGSIAFHTSSMAVGFQAKAQFQNSLAIGKGANASGSDCLALGANALASGSNTCVIGSQATGSGAQTTVYGKGASSPNVNTVVIGYLAKTNQDSCVSIGSFADVRGTNTVGIGPNVIVGGNGVIIGHNASGSFIAIGQAAVNNSYPGAIAIGQSAANTANLQLMFSPLARVSFGPEYVSAQTGLVMGMNSVTSGVGNGNCGHWTFAGPRGTGTGSGGKFIFQVAPSSSVSGSEINQLITSMEISQTPGMWFTGPGLNGGAGGSGSMSITDGQIGADLGSGSIAIGINARAFSGQTNAIAIGRAATTNTNGVSIGDAASVTNTAGVAIGKNALAATNATALGSTANANATEAISIGQASTSTGTSAIAIGVSTAVSQSNSIALGRGVVTNAASQFVVGSSTAPISNVYLGNGINSTNPQDVTIHASDGAGTNVTGSNLILAGGISAGTQIGGSLLFQTSPTGTSGNTANALTTKFSINGTGSVAQKSHANFPYSEVVTFTNAIQTTGSAPVTMMTLPLQIGTMYWLEAKVIGWDTINSQRGTFSIFATAYRSSSAAATLAGIRAIVPSDITSVPISASFSASSNNINLTVNGIATATMNWAATFEYQAISSSV